MALGLAFGRVGCLFNGCCFGGEVEGHWPAIQFPHYNCVEQQSVSPPYWQQLTLGRLHGLRIGASAESPAIQNVESHSEAERVGLRVGMGIKAIDERVVRSLDEAKRALGTAGPRISLQTLDGQRFTWSIEKLPPRSLPVHPSQIYSAINAALLCLFLWALLPFRPRDGVVFASGMTLYPLTRFLLEVIRDDEPGRLGTPFTISQIISLSSLILVAALWYYLARRESHRGPQLSAPSAH
jgi:phosphatidylglycerol:prolipoprotein diacylglycerol transferase